MERPGLSARGGLRDLIKVRESANIRPTDTPPAHTREKTRQHAIERPFWAIFPALGEYFRAVVIDRPRRANFVAPMRSTAPQHVTVSTNAGTSRHRYETHDAFAR